LIAQILHYAFILVMLYFFVLAASNIIWLRLSSRRPKRRSGAKVSVLIPARDEEAHIVACLDSLLHQTYDNYEIVVLDDHSTDRTWEIISGYQRRHPEKIRVVRGEPLPESSWFGKPHALQQLSQYATGQFFMFTDADTIHGPESISWAVTNLIWHRVDFISGYVRQKLLTFGEALLVPATYLMTTVIMPLWLIAVTRTPVFSFAVGQVVMFRRKAFEAIGGFSSVSQRISEDIYVCRLLKKAGFRVIFLDLRKHVSCRMYEGYSRSFNGIAKNIYDFFNRRPGLLAGSTVLVACFMILPWILLVAHLLDGNPLVREAAVAVVLLQLTWCFVLYDRGLKWYVPFLQPLMFPFLLAMMWRSYGALTFGEGILWKGRVVR
jgi:chlorobactene glucosyltransferase